MRGVHVPVTLVESSQREHVLASAVALFVKKKTFITDCRAKINGYEYLGNRSSTTDSSLLLVLRRLTLIIQQHVLRFEVSVDDPLLVEVLHALDDLSSVVTGSRLVKAGVVLVHVVDVIPGQVMITVATRLF